MKRIGMCTGMALFLCAACHRASPVIWRGHQIILQNRIVTEAAAMQALFGNYSVASYSSRWTTSIYSTTNPKQEETQISTVFAKDLSKSNAFTLAISTNPPDSHCRICAPILSFFEFTQASPGEWVLSQQQDLGPMGFYGSPPAARLVEIGPSRSAFEFTFSNLHLGVASDTLSLYAKVNGAYSQVFKLDSFDSTDGACLSRTTCTHKPGFCNFPDSCGHREATYRFLNKRSEFYPIAVTINITTQNQQQQIRTEQLKQYFAFNGSVYAETKGAE
jgi:hypothetical protein